MSDCLRAAQLEQELTLVAAERDALAVEAKKLKVRVGITVQKLGLKATACTWVHWTGWLVSGIETGWQLEFALQGGPAALSFVGAVLPVPLVQAAVVNLGNMLLTADKEVVRLSKTLQQQQKDLLTQKKQLQVASEWLQEDAERLAAGRTATSALQ